MALLFCGDQLLLDQRQAEDRLTQGKGQRRADFQDRKVIAHQLAERFRGLIIRRVGLKHQRR
ncbi:hypothetical protein D3C76_1406350 [compost metagenome]